MLTFIPSMVGNYGCTICIEQLTFEEWIYEGRAKSSVTNMIPKFYPKYILKYFTALEWCVEKLTIPVYFVQIAFQLTELFQIEIDAVIYTEQFTCYIRHGPADWNS